MAELSARTLQEMEAGRRVVYRNMAETRLEDGMNNLRKMFPSLRIVCLVDPPDWSTKLTITCRVLEDRPGTRSYPQIGATIFEHTDPVESFPSDFLIAQLALISQ